MTAKFEKRGGRVFKTLTCKRSGRHQSKVDEDYRIRNRSSFKHNCPVSVRAREQKDGSWTLSHREAQFCTHNHEPGNASAFPEHRKLSEQQISTVASHYMGGIPPSRTVALLQQQDPDLNVYHHDIYNITAVMSRARRQNKSPPQAFIDVLDAEKIAGRIYFEWRADQAGHIAIFFIADTRSVQYLNQHPDILLLDCTYKTNKFDMPLLHVIGIDHHGNSFTVALCWLDSEISANYDEAIQHLVKLFQPQIWPSVIATDCEVALIEAIDKYFPAFRSKRALCYWHIAKCVTTKCKAFFSTIERWEGFLKGFNQVVFAKTQEEYEDILAEFKAEFHWNDGNPYSLLANATPEEQALVLDQELERQALVYVIGQWLVPYFKLIVHAWVDSFFHGGTTTTSAFEGSHAVLKRWYGKPTKQLIALYDSSKLAINDQLNEIASNHSSRALWTALLSNHPQDLSLRALQDEAAGGYYSTPERA